MTPADHKLINPLQMSCVQIFIIGLSVTDLKSKTKTKDIPVIRHKPDLGLPYISRNKSGKII